MIAALRLARSHHLLRRLLLLQAISRCADAAAMAILAHMVVFGLEHGVNPGSLGTTVAVMTAPSLVVGPMGGVLVDALSARRLLLGVHLARAALMSLAIAVPVIANSAVGYSIGGALLIAGGISVTARAAALPRLVDADDLVTANASTSLVSRAAGPIGVVLGIGLCSQWIAGALLVAAGLEVVAALGYLRFAPRLDRDVATDRTHRPTSVAPTVRCQQVRRCMGSVLGHRTLFGAAFAASVLLLTSRYDMNAAGYASAMSVTGTGAFIGTVLAPRLARWMSRRWLVVLSFLLPAVAMWAAALHPVTVLVLAAMAGAAFALQVVRLVTDATIQQRVAERERGRVVSWFDAAHVVAFCIGVLLLLFLAHDRPAAAFAPLAVAHLIGAVAFSVRRRPALAEALG